jgi:gas vesicle protein
MKGGSMQAGKGFLGLLIGGAIGSSIAFLFAPKKGEKVRKDIKSNFDDIVNKTKDRSKRLFNQSMDTVDDIIKKSDELRALLKEYKEGTYAGTIDKIENEIKKLRAALFAAIDTYKKSRGKEKSSDELINNIYNEFESERIHKHEETIR